MHLRSKLTSEIWQKIGSLDEITEQSCLKVPTLTKKKKSIAFIEKQKTQIDFPL